MDVAMQLKINGREADELLEKYYKRGKIQQKIIEKKSEEVFFNKFKSPRGTLNGQLMTSDCFPITHADIFISHSHQDEKLAISLAGKLKKELGITCFIDSTVWKHVYELLRLIDDEFCRKSQSGIYDYTKRNYSTAHVHMMLSVALSRMIDTCEAFLFLNTSNSLIPEYLSEAIEGVLDNKPKTFSPWIYYELSVSHLIRKPLEECRNKELIEKLRSTPSCKNFSESSREVLKVEYEIDTSHLMMLNMNKIDSICNKWRKFIGDSWMAYTKYIDVIDPQLYRSQYLFANKDKALDAIYRCLL